MTLSTSYLVAFAGFLFMLMCALVFVGNLHKLGRAGLEQLSRSMRAVGLREALGGAGKKMRDRFKREDEE
jgi:hypothetical protein